MFEYGEIGSAVIMAVTIGTSLLGLYGSPKIIDKCLFRAGVKMPLPLNQIPKRIELGAGKHRQAEKRHEPGPQDASTGARKDIPREVGHKKSFLSASETARVHSHPS